LKLRLKWAWAGHGSALPTIYRDVQWNDDALESGSGSKSGPEIRERSFLFLMMAEKNSYWLLVAPSAPSDTDYSLALTGKNSTPASGSLSTRLYTYVLMHNVPLFRG
jgi:hypothetical protein